MDLAYIMLDNSQPENYLRNSILLHMIIEIILEELQMLASPVKAAFYPRFFKTGPGQYAEGDLFIGVTVPHIRMIAQKYSNDMGTDVLADMLRNPYHEMRLCALIMLLTKYKKEKKQELKEKYVDLYLSRLDYVNNWDLVDTSAPGILGHWLYEKDKSVLYVLANSNHLWRQRVSIITTLYFIKKGKTEDTFHIAQILLQHPHHLIHKAVGWMLREAAKIHFKQCHDFLMENHKRMPRTMLRYAIEKFDEPLRKKILSGCI